MRILKAILKTIFDLIKDKVGIYSPSQIEYEKWKEHSKALDKGLDKDWSSEIDDRNTRRTI